MILYLNGIIHCSQHAKKCQVIFDPILTTTARLIYRFLPKGTLEFAAKNGYVISLDENDYESHKVEASVKP